HFLYGFKSMGNPNKLPTLTAIYGSRIFKEIVDRIVEKTKDNPSAIVAFVSFVKIMSKVQWKS
ncbi:hypothetical protein ACJBPP_11285, partial [Streptococcus suis]